MQAIEKKLPYNHPGFVDLFDIDYEPERGTLVYYNSNLNRAYEDVEFIGYVHDTHGGICYITKEPDMHFKESPVSMSREDYKKYGVDCFIYVFRGEGRLNDMHRFLKQ